MPKKPRRIYRGKRGIKTLARDVVMVDRPSRWSNPFFIQNYRAIPWTTIELAARLKIRVRFFRCETKQEAADKFEEAFLAGKLEITPMLVWEHLRGCDLACFDREHHPSHADTLLKIANGPRPK